MALTVVARVLGVVFFLITSILANTEKTIFLGPKPVSISSREAHLNAFDALETLTPDNGTLRTQLTAQFPTAEQPYGRATWLILDGLAQNQRYEVRVCWPATQPTEFIVETFSLTTLWDTPELAASLAAYSASRPSQPKSAGSGDRMLDASSSMLYLRILAAADYYSTDPSLMNDVPLVDVDIILDPFLFNLLPRSIAGTACFIVIVTIASAIIALRSNDWLKELLTPSVGPRQGRVGTAKKKQ